MAEGGEQLGLAELELRVDYQSLDAGLEEARKRINAFVPEFSGVQEALRKIGAQLDATFSGAGVLPTGGGAPAPAGPATPPAAGGAAAPSAAGVSDSKEEKRQTQEAQKQTEEERKQTEIARRALRNQSQAPAPQRFERSVPAAAAPQRAQAQEFVAQSLREIAAARDELRSIEASRPRSARGRQARAESIQALEARIENLSRSAQAFLDSLESATKQITQRQGIEGVVRGSNTGAQRRNLRREQILIDRAQREAGPEGPSLRELLATQRSLEARRNAAPVGSDRQLRLTDALNQLNTRIRNVQSVGDRTLSPALTARAAAQGGARDNIRSRENLQNFERTARARLDALEQRGAPDRATRELRDLLGRITTAQGRGQFGTAERLRREFESRRSAATQRQSITERSGINERRERNDEFRTTRDISNEQFQLNRAKRDGVNISEAQLRLDRAAQLAAEGRREEARSQVLQSRELRRNSELDARQQAAAGRAAEQERRREIAQAPSTGGLEQGRAAERIADDLQSRVTRLRSQGFDTAPFEKGIQDARKKLVEGQLLGARRQLEDIGRRVSLEEDFGTRDAGLRRLQQQRQREAASEQRAADRRATVPAITAERGNNIQLALRERENTIQEFERIGGDSSRFRERLKRAQQDLLDSNVVAVERELKRLQQDLKFAKADQQRANRAAGQPLSFGSAREALAFAPRIETPAQLKEYEAALKKLLSQTAATDAGFDPLNAVLKQVSAALKGGTTDAAAFAGSLKRIREEAARVRAPELGAPLPPPRPGAPPPPPRPSADERRRALEAADEQRRAAEAAQTQRRQRPPVLPQPAPRRGLLERSRDFFGNQRVQGALSSGLIGGGFPLLFGQGAGAGLGGLLGGIGGGALGGGFGFGASIVGTLIGTAIDSLVQRFGTLAQALRDPIASLDAFIQNATLASAAQERYVQALVGAGRTAEAAQVVRNEAGRTIDPGSALLLADAQDRYNRTLSDAQDILGNLVAGPATQFLNFLTDIAKAVGARPGDAPRSLTGPRAAQDARRERLTGFSTVGTGAGIAAGGLALSFANPLIGLPLLGTGLATAAVGAGQIGSGDAKERVANSREVRQIENDINATTDRQLRIQQQINAAKAAGRSESAAALEQSKELAAIDQRRNQAVLEAQAAFAALTPEQQAEPNNQDRRNDAINLARRTADLEAESIVAAQRGSTANAERELANARRLVGLSGERLQIEQSRIAVEAAARNRDSSNQQLRDVQVERSNGTATDDEVTLALERQKQAEAEYTRVVLEEGEKRRRAIANENVQRLESIALLEQIRQRTEVAQLGPGLSGDGRQAIEAVQAVQRARQEEAIALARLNTDPGNPQLLAASQAASQNVVLASAEARNNLFQAFQAAQQAVQSIARSVEDAELRLSELRGGSEGVNQFLSPQAQLRRQEAEFENLLPQFLAVREQLARSQSDSFVANNIRGINFSGRTQDVNRDITNFIRAARDEIRSQQDLKNNQVQLKIAEENKNLVANLVKSNEVNVNLNNAVSLLKTAVDDLTSKDWLVNINVPGGTATGDVIGAVNSFS